MKKADWQYLVDTLLFICIVGIALIGILHFTLQNVRNIVASLMKK